MVKTDDWTPDAIIRLAAGMDLSLSPGKRVAKRIRGTLDDPGPIEVSCHWDVLYFLEFIVLTVM